MKLLGDFSVVLKNGRFMRLWLAQGISNFGDAIARIALMVLITTRTQSAAAISLVVAVQVIPAIVLGPFAGVFVDRWNRKTILVVSDVIRTALIVGIAYATEVWQICLLSMLMSVCSCFFTPARMSLTPEIVGEEQFMAARSLTQSTYQAMTLIGPALGGMIIGFAGLNVAFLIDAATFLFSALIIGVTFLPESTREGTSSSFGTEFREGLRFIGGSKQLRFLLTSLGIMLLIAGGYGVLLVDYVNNVLGATPTQFGLVESTMAGGLLLASLVIGYFGTKLNRGSVIFNSMVGIGLCSLFFFTQPGIIALYIWAFVLGAADGCADLPISSLLIEFTPKDKRGRVLSVYSSIIRVCALVGLAMVGPLAELIGTAYLIGVMGVVILMVGIVARYMPAFALLNQGKQDQTESNVAAEVS